MTRSEALGFAAIQAAIDCATLAATGHLHLLYDSPPPPPEALNAALMQGGLLTTGLNVLALPAYAALAARANARVFGRVLSVGAFGGAFRLLKAQLMGGLSLVAVTVLPLAFALQALRAAVPAPHGGLTSLLTAVAIIAALGLVVVHLLYPLGVFYEGHMSFAAARRLCRGRRWAMAGSLLLLGFALLVGLGVFVLVPVMVIKNPYLTLLTGFAAGPISTAMTLPLFVLCSHYYFEALDRAGMHGRAS